MDFATLRKVNVNRCVNGFKHMLSDWSCAEWGNATAGEVGEACNIAKKILRIDGGHALKNKDRGALVEMLKEELADVAIYLDLWAASEGIDLAQAIKDKFNKDTDKRNLASYPEYRL